MQSIKMYFRVQDVSSLDNLKGVLVMKEWKDLTEASKTRWNTNAHFWDDYMGDHSNDFHRTLIRPYTEELLMDTKGKKVLDVGCGNGNFSRRLYELGAIVTAFDYSKEMIERAKLRSTNEIDYRVIDGTDYDELLSLGKDTYELAVANMVLMDMSEIRPLIRALYDLLCSNGTFVFSITHPCFQTPGNRRIYEEEEVGNTIVSRRSVQISRYIKPESFEGVGIRNQPTASIYFHRPLSALLKLFFDNGFVLDGIVEPTFKEDNTKRFEWIEIPAAIVIRMRKAASFRGDSI